MYSSLQLYWWIIVSLLGGLLVFMMFVQGSQTLVKSLAQNEDEKNMIINSVGRKWELTFTTLVMFGGACFAAFPLFYATSFGGAYWVWMLILFCFIIQAVSYEYRRKDGNFLGQKTYDNFLYINGSLGVILIGIAVSTFFSGSAFILNDNNFVQWQSAFRGLEALINPFNYLLGIALFFLARIGGALYIKNNIDNEELRNKATRAVVTNATYFLPFFLVFVAWLCLRSGYAYDENGIVSLVKYKYFLNLIQMPLVGIMFLFGVIFVLLSIAIGGFSKNIHGIWFFGLGATLSVMAVFLISGLNGTAFYPSYVDLQNSLTIANASSSPYTLKVMTYVSVLIPFVLSYIIYVWHAMDKKKITLEEINSSKKELY